METAAIDKLFLELSQFTTAKTKREIQLERELTQLKVKQKLSLRRDEARQQEIAQLRAEVSRLQNEYPTCAHCRGEIGVVLTTLTDQAKKDAEISQLKKERDRAASKIPFYGEAVLVERARLQQELMQVLNSISNIYAGLGLTEENTKGVESVSSTVLGEFEKLKRDFDSVLKSRGVYIQRWNSVSQALAAKESENIILTRKLEEAFLEGARWGYENGNLAPTDFVDEKPNAWLEFSTNQLKS